MNIENPTLVMIGALGVTILLLVVMMYVWPGDKKSKNVGDAAQILTPFILVVTAVILYHQLGHIQGQNKELQDQNKQFRKQNELQRNVASKSAIQALNEVILDKDNRDFLPFLFPQVPATNDEASGEANALTDEEKEARKTMMAFSLMNSLEMLYLTQDEKRREDEASRAAFRKLLAGFTGKARKIWEDSPTFATVYHPEFREIVEETFAETDEGSLAQP